MITNVSPEIDPSGLANLNRLGGPEFVKKMIDLFGQEIPKRLAAARTGEQTGDLAIVADAAHSIKSSALNFGAHNLNVIAERIEILAHAKNCEQLPALLAELEQAYATVQAWLDTQKMTF